MDNDTAASVSGIQRDPDLLAAYRRDASGLVANPEAVARPRDEQDLDEIITAALKARMPITPVGGLSSTTGAPLAPCGLALDMRGLSGLVDLQPHPTRNDARIAIVRPGTNLAALQDQLAEAGWLYPPDPTSAPDCTVGGSVATNASGPRSFAYGSTRHWVAGVELCDGTGRRTWLRRDYATKHALGYGFVANPLDLVVGSEGSLGILRVLELTVIPKPAQVVGLWCSFADLEAALTWLNAARRLASRSTYNTTIPDGATASVGPAATTLLALEGFDAAALGILRRAAGAASLVGNSATAIYAELAPPADAETSAWLVRWLDAVATAGGGEPLDVRPLHTPTQQALFTRLRHHLPATMNELGTTAAAAGGRKLSTDWAVPPERLGEMFAAVDQALVAAQLEHLTHVRYGHWGDGHPHHNLIAPDAATLTRLLPIIEALYDHARTLGGSFAAEHGIGKLKAAYWRRSLPAPILAAARAIKRALDPHELMAPGNFWG